VQAHASDRRMPSISSVSHTRRMRAGLRRSIEWTHWTMRWAHPGVAHVVDHDPISRTVSRLSFLARCGHRRPRRWLLMLVLAEDAADPGHHYCSSATTTPPASAPRGSGHTSQPPFRFVTGPRHAGTSSIAPDESERAAICSGGPRECLRSSRWMFTQFSGEGDVKVAELRGGLKSGTEAPLWR